MHDKTEQLAVVLQHPDDQPKNYIVICGYNKNCVLYPWIWVNEINFGRFRCVVNDRSYTLL